MNSTIGDQLAAEWHDDEDRIKDWFHHRARHDATPALHGPTIAIAELTPAPADQENTMSVPDAVADLKTNVEAAQAANAAAGTALAAVLANDVAGLQDIGAQIDNSRLIQAAVAADLVVPQGVLDAEAAALEALTAAFTPVTPVTPAEVPADQPAA